MKKTLALLLSIVICLSAFTSGISVLAAAPLVEISDTVVSGQAGGGAIVVSGSGFSNNTTVTLKLTVPKELDVIDIDGLSEYDESRLDEDDYTVDWMRGTDQNGDTLVKIVVLINGSFSYNVNVKADYNLTTEDRAYSITGVSTYAGWNDSTITAVSVASGNFTVKAREMAAIDYEGFSIDTNEDYQFSQKLTVAPHTYEATVYFPRGWAERSVILGAARDEKLLIRLEITAEGNPKLYLNQPGGFGTSFTFDKVNLYAGEWVHFALVMDKPTHSFLCYINGELAQTAKGTTAIRNDVILDYGLIFGNNLKGNDDTNPFNGRMKNFTLYSDERTAAEVAADVNSYAKDNLLVRFEEDADENIVDGFYDVSGNNNHAVRKNYYLDETAPLDDYDYTFAFVPDTQIVNYYDNTNMDKIYDWIVAQNPEFVLGLGDITDKSQVFEWETAKKQFDKLNAANIPFSLVRGNHDSIATYDSSLSYAKYGNTTGVGGTFQGDTMRSYWQELVLGEGANQIKYLMLSMDYGMTDAMIDWANGVIASHPEHNVIITTHGYIDHLGNRINTGSQDANVNDWPNKGDAVWNKLVSQHANIVMIVCGHYGTDEMVVSEDIGVNGNIVKQIQIDYQWIDNYKEPIGAISLFHFSEGGSKIQVETYSPIKEKYLLEGNQRTITVNVVGKTAAPEIESVNGTTVTLKAVSGYEYSLGGTAWQASPVFTNIAVDSKVKFYQRPTSDISKVSAVKEILITSAPEVLLGADTLRVVPKDGYKYSTDGVNWYDANFFWLDADTDYTLYARPKYTGVVECFSIAATATTNGTNAIENPTADDLVWLKKQLILFENSRQLGADHNADGIINILDYVAMSKDIAE